MLLYEQPDQAYSLLAYVIATLSWLEKDDLIWHSYISPLAILLANPETDRERGEMCVMLSITENRTREAVKQSIYDQSCGFYF